MATALAQFAKHLKAAAQHEAAMKSLRKECKKELNAIEGKITTVNGVKFHMTKKLKETIYPDGIQAVLEDLKSKIDAQKKGAEDAGVVEKKYAVVFDAEIIVKE